MKAIEIIMIPVKDRQAAKAFYQQLGFEVRIEAPDPHGDTWIQMGLPGDSATISLAGFPAVLCETADIAAECAALKKKGIAVGEIDTTPWGQFAWIKDADGNGLCLHQR